MKVTIRGDVSYCPDCNSEHMSAPCGMSYKDRLASQRNDTLWMPAKNNGRSNYYDSDALKEIFPEDAKEQMMEETKGRGPWKPGDDMQHAADLMGVDVDE